MIELFPPLSVIQKEAREAPSFKRPNELPFAVAAPAYLKTAECNALLSEIHPLPAQQNKLCEAVTRDCGYPLGEVYNPIISYVKAINRIYWKYDIDDTPGAFHQSYSHGGSYQLHMDGNVGQTRKLTVVTMLSDPNEYEGGDLLLHYHPNKWAVPKARGTIVIFLSWLLHEVTEITAGRRETLNLGFWGPPFR